MGTQKVDDYFACLLRIWREGEDSPWRASLQDPHTGELTHFASPQQAFVFIEKQMNEEGKTAVSAVER